MHYLPLLLILAGTPLPNPGFEDGETLWALNDDSSELRADAAHSGQLGLRVGASEYNPRGASVFSARLPAEPGAELTIDFWARTNAGSSGVYLYFYNAQGKTVSVPHMPMKVPDKFDWEWHEYQLQATVPDGAERFCIWVHSFSGVAGLTNYDDFSVSGTADGEPVPSPVRKPKPIKAIAPEDLPQRAAPPLIVLKLDDFKLSHGKVRRVWRELAELFRQKGVKAGYGVLAETLPEATPETVAWMKEQHDSGLIEFWFHGWDHASHRVDGKLCSEFYGRSYEAQKQRFVDSEQLCQAQFGFSFATFGPPGGPTISWTDETYRVMADVPEMKVWLYAQPIDDAGRALAAAGKVTILDRVWGANLESAVGVPDYKAFVAGYAANASRPYFVLQGHPEMWNEGRYGEFLKILEFLLSQHAEFVTPTECAAKVEP